MDIFITYKSYCHSPYYYDTDDAHELLQVSRTDDFWPVFCAATGSGAHAPCQSPSTFLLFATIGEKRGVTRGKGGRSEENCRRSEKQSMTYTATSVEQKSAAAVRSDRTERTDYHRRDLVPSERIAPHAHKYTTGKWPPPRNDGW